MCFKLMKISMYHFIQGSLSFAERPVNQTGHGDSLHLFGKMIPLHICTYKSGFGVFFSFPIRQNMFSTLQHEILMRKFPLNISMLK